MPQRRPKGTPINPEAFVVVVGLRATRPDTIAGIDGVDLVLGAQEKFNLVDHLHDLRNAHEARPLPEKSRKCVPLFLAIPVGIEPVRFEGSRRMQLLLLLLHHPPRSGSFAERERRRHAEAGGTGHRGRRQGNRVDWGEHWGLRTAHGETLLDLVLALDELPGVERFRISSIEPNLLSDELIDAVARSKKFQPHFHIPLQSGNDEMLASMRRRYRTELYQDRVAHIRRVMPDASIGVDVIVGFPGESEGHFNTTVDFIKSLDVSYLHVFTYSERPNTTALRIDDVVPMEERKRRNKVLRALSLKLQRMHYERQLHRTHAVLFEAAEEDGLRFGYTSNYVRVAARAADVEANAIRPVELTRIHAAGHASGNLRANA